MPPTTITYTYIQNLFKQVESRANMLYMYIYIHIYIDAENLFKKCLQIQGGDNYATNYNLGLVYFFTRYVYMHVYVCIM